MPAGLHFTNDRLAKTLVGPVYSMRECRRNLHGFRFESGLLDFCELTIAQG